MKLASNEIKLVIKKGLKLNVEADINDGGVGGVRTLVQTRNRAVFYMLIRLLVFERRQANDSQSTP